MKLILCDDEFLCINNLHNRRLLIRIVKSKKKRTKNKVGVTGF